GRQKKGESFSCRSTRSVVARRDRQSERPRERASVVCGGCQSLETSRRWVTQPSTPGCTGTQASRHRSHVGKSDLPHLCRLDSIPLLGGGRCRRVAHPQLHRSLL